MKAGKVLTRRAVLQSALVFTMLQWLRPLHILEGLSFLDSARPDTARLLSCLLHRGSAAAVGRAYLHLRPNEADERMLVRRILGAGRIKRKSLLTSSPDAIRAILERLHRKDFERHQTVEVKGWVLSATEARLYALAAVV